MRFGTVPMFRTMLKLAMIGVSYTIINNGPFPMILIVTKFTFIMPHRFTITINLIFNEFVTAISLPLSIFKHTKTVANNINEKRVFCYKLRKNNNNHNHHHRHYHHIKDNFVGPTPHRIHHWDNGIYHVPA